MVMSARPPGPKPMTMRMGRAGYDDCAFATVAQPISSATSKPVSFVTAPRLP
jgi:hypothetical protein